MVMQSCLFTKKIPSIISSRTKSMQLCIFIWVLNPFQLALQSSLLHLFQGEVTCIMCIFTLLPLYLLWSLTDSYTYISHMEKTKTKQPTPSSLPPPQQAQQKNDLNTNKQKNPNKKIHPKQKQNPPKSLKTKTPPYLLSVHLCSGSDIFPWKKKSIDYFNPLL